MHSELIRKGGCFLGQGRWQKLQQQISPAYGLKVEATSGVSTLCVNKSVQFGFRESSPKGEFLQGGLDSKLLAANRETAEGLQGNIVI